MWIFFVAGRSVGRRMVMWESSSIGLENQTFGFLSAVLVTMTVDPVFSAVWGSLALE